MKKVRRETISRPGEIPRKKPMQPGVRRRGRKEEARSEEEPHRKKEELVARYELRRQQPLALSTNVYSRS